MSPSPDSTNQSSTSALASAWSTCPAREGDPRGCMRDRFDLVPASRNHHAKRLCLRVSKLVLDGVDAQPGAVPGGSRHHTRWGGSSILSSDLGAAIEEADVGQVRVAVRPRAAYDLSCRKLCRKFRATVSEIVPEGIHVEWGAPRRIFGCSSILLVIQEKRTAGGFP